MASEILGHIDCPTCGTKSGMRITHDKNGEPFGYCEVTCNQQLRIGGDKNRVKLFISRYSWAGLKVSEPVTVIEPKQVKQPVTDTQPKTPHWSELLGVKS